MNKNIIRQAIDDIRATDEFKNRLYDLMTEGPEAKAVSVKYRKCLLALTACFVTGICVICAIIIYGVILPKMDSGEVFVTSVGGITINRGESAGSAYGTFIEFGCGGGKVSDMHLSDGKLFYTNHEGKLFCYDQSLKTGKLISDIEISQGASFFEQDGYIYYGNGNAIFKRSLKDNVPLKLLSGENIWIDGINDGRLFYHISYKDAVNGGFTQSEIHMYELSTGNDRLIFNRSEGMWRLLAFDGDTIIADANLKGDSGIFSIDISTGTRKKISNLRVNQGCIINGEFYYTPDDMRSLWALYLNKGKQHKIKVPGMNKENFFVDNFTGFGDFLYVAVYYNNNSHIIKVNLKTFDTEMLAKGFGRVWRLCTDGKALYAYDSKSPEDVEGKITVIDLN